MTAAQRKALSRYVLYLLRELDLRDWTIQLRHHTLDEEDDALARIRPTFGRRRAQLWVCPELAELEPEVVRQTLVHELLHCHTAGLQHHAQELRDLLGAAAHDAWMLGMRQFVENAVDGIAEAFARQCDEIDWTNKRRYRC